MDCKDERLVNQALSSLKEIEEYLNKNLRPLHEYCNQLAERICRKCSKWNEDIDIMSDCPDTCNVKQLTFCVIMSIGDEFSSEEEMN